MTRRGFMGGYHIYIYICVLYMWTVVGEPSYAVFLKNARSL